MVNGHHDVVDTLFIHFYYYCYNGKDITFPLIFVVRVSIAV